MMRKLGCILMSAALILIGMGPCAGSVAVAGDIPALLDQYVSGMSLEEKVGQLFMTAVTGTELSAGQARIIKKNHTGGIVLYRYNFQNTEQTVRLTDILQKTAGSIPLFIAADQEGGRVTRLPMGTNMPGNMALGAARSLDCANKAGFFIGQELKSLGINVNLAPVLDVHQNSGSSAIGIRSFGADPQLVADMGQAYIKGLREAGVISTVKHFPGHGDTPLDSHSGSPVIPYATDRLRKVELKPFQQAFDNEACILMTAHVAYPAVDDTTIFLKRENRNLYIPATLSYKVLTGMARNEMGFKGVILTDALHMKAVISFSGSQEEAVVAAIKAGADMLMVHTGLEKANKRVIDAVKKGEISVLRIDRSVKRILELKLNTGLIKISGGGIAPGDEFNLSIDERVGRARAIVGSPENRAAEQNLAEKAVTVLKNDNVLPFEPVDGSSIVFFVPSKESLAVMQSAIESAVKAKGLNNVRVTGFAYSMPEGFTAQHKIAIGGADFVIHGSCSYSEPERSPKGWRGAFSSDLISYVNAQDKLLAVMAIGDPYDIMFMPGAKAYLAVYGTANGPNVPAGVNTIFGLNNPTGKLPVPIPASDGTGLLYPEGYGINW